MNSTDDRLIPDTYWPTDTITKATVMLDQDEFVEKVSGRLDDRWRRLGESTMRIEGWQG